jgi:effector-binding domain-containing protein
MNKFSLPLLLLLLTGCAVSDVKEPAFTVLETHEAISVREYAPMLVAEVTMSGERNKAINDGFRVLADYIFGNNRSQQKIAMTAPVTQQASEKIAMTAPVIQQSDPQGQGWLVRFVMPANYTTETLPQPVDSRVRIISVPAHKMVVIRFSGTSSAANLSEHEQALRTWLASSSYKSNGGPVYAFYNPPWTLPWWRRNEILMAVE